MLWYAPKDSNLELTGYKPGTLTVELRAHIVVVYKTYCRRKLNHSKFFMKEVFNISELVRDTRLELVRYTPRDFKSLASADSANPAYHSL